MFGCRRGMMRADRDDEIECSKDESYSTRMKRAGPTVVDLVAVDGFDNDTNVWTCHCRREHAVMTAVDGKSDDYRKYSVSTRPDDSIAAGAN